MAHLHPYQRCVEDPHYSYPPSLSTYAFLLKKSQNNVLINSETEKHKNQWKTLFAFPYEKIHLEIGCNTGLVLLAKALQYPKHFFIGLDWKYRAIFRAQEKAAKLLLKNTFFLRAHALRLPYIFGPKEIDEISVFFPDPWPKQKHTKNRWITQKSLQNLANLITYGGILTIKTDDFNYFQWILDATQKQSRWKITECIHHLYHHHSNPHQLDIPEVTPFEKIFIQKQIPIQKLTLQRI